MIVKRRKTSNIQKKACLASNQIQNSKCLFFFFFFGTNVPFHTLTQIEIVDNHEYQQIKDVREE